jgi:hypothetical protein
MTESDLDYAVRQLAALLGVKVYSVRNSKAGVVTSRGYPDLTLAGRNGVAWRELKSGRGQLTREQLEWGHALTEAGQDWAVWRPADLAASIIIAEIRQLAGRTRN